MSIPRFFKDDEHREQFLANLKLIECPHCGKTAYLICNGLLKVNNPDQHGCQQVERGQRIFCSNRNNRRGCGRSFSMLQSDRLPNCSIDSSALNGLLTAVRKTAGCIFCQCTGPPECTFTEPRLQLLAHLRAAFQTDDPIRSFQAHFQTPFLPSSENQMKPVL